MHTDSPTQAIFPFAVLPALVPASCYLLLEQLPVAYAVALAAFVATPIASGAALGWRHAGMPTGRYVALAIAYALASVLVAELADALVPLVALNLVNLPAYAIVAALLFSAAGLIARSLRASRRPERSLS